MDIPAYLERIGCRDHRIDVDIATLRDLHRSHMLTVPFENLDIHLRRQIVLEDQALFRKIVCDRRGGFCYELNGLFCALLRELGYHVSMLSAGVAREQGGFGPEFDHITLLVELEQNWLADVGFGDSFIEPLLLDSTSDQIQANGCYRLERDGGFVTLMRRTCGFEWAPQYRFTLRTHSLSEYGDMCLYHQTSPLSSFVQKRVVTRATADGRITLSEMRLITTTRRGDRTERNLADADEYDRVLLNVFGMQVPRRHPGE